VLRRDDLWIWDSWPVEDGDDRHLFYLQAPRALGDPIARHTHAAVGHAVSPDWEHWTILPDALTASPSPAWDDLAIWTGSIVRGDTGRWHFFYTALSQHEGGRVQRIGRADSDDLITWHRAGAEPLLCADPRWYETIDQMDWHEETWRDPWVLRDPEGDGWHMLITARDPVAPRLRDGILGHARSADLVTWELGPPLTAPAGFGQLEVPQVRCVDGTWLLVFTTAGQHWSEAYRRSNPQSPVTGTHYLMADDPRGPWTIAPGAFLDGAEPCKRYAARIVKTAAGLRILGFADGGKAHFGGYIMDPEPVEVLADGRLEVAPARRAAE